VSLKLPSSPSTYSAMDQASTRQLIERADVLNVKKNEEFQPLRLVLSDTVTGDRYLVTVASGALTLTLIT
jgi:hypothetical protein